MSKLIVSGPHLQSRDPVDWQVETVGYKAAGLNDLPLAWTPAFIVLTTLAYGRWRKDLESLSGLSSSEIHWLVSEAELGKYIGPLSCNGTRALIVRSSGTLETLQQRGRYESRRCSANIEDVLETATSVWRKVTPLLARSAQAPGSVALVVQTYITPLARGHLSNERRVGHVREVWLNETEDLSKPGIRINRFSVRKLSKSEDVQDLFCRTLKEVSDRIKAIAAASSRRGNRVHYEWVWDGQRLWIVQGDAEEDYHGSPPGSAWKVRKIASGKDRHSPLVFTEEPGAVGDWRKIENVRTFRACGLPTASLYVLEDKSALHGLSVGHVSEPLQMDLDWLLRFPTVIRTDVSKSASYPAVMLPRTEALRTPGEAAEFLLKTASVFTAAGLKPSDFCFIAHIFILSRSSALSFSKPEVPRVRIDATWGLPDGLHYYPYDSFEVGPDNTILKRIRCKMDYLDINENGSWIQKRAGQPWDWKQSLNRDEAIQVARLSRSLATHLGRPVAIMFFVGVHPATGHPLLMPWYYTTEALPEFDYEPSDVIFAGERFVVSDEADLDDLRTKAESGSLSGRLTIRLKPRPELLRSNEFTAKVADLAIERKLPIELEGSVLSHAYYVLSSRGVRIRCIEPFEPYGMQRFGKLVRDLIPLRIESAGEEVTVYKVPLDKLISLVKTKFMEEGLELYWASDVDASFREVVDLFELVRTLTRLYGRTWNELTATAKAKREERGGFEEGLVLIETREVPLIARKPRELPLFAEAGQLPAASPRRQELPTRFESVEPRKPEVKRGEIILPLVPPSPHQKSLRTIIPLYDRDLEFVITYRQKEISVTIQPARPKINSRQTLLFPID